MKLITSPRFTDGVEWSPALMPSPVLWLDASNAGSITSSGGAVSQWNDLSGSGRHVSQSTESWKPGTGAQTQNGLNVLTFDGADFLDHDAVTDAIDLSPVTMFIVGRYDSTTTTYGRILSGRQTAWPGGRDIDSPNFAVVRTGSDSIEFSSAGTPPSTPLGYVDDTFFVFCGKSNGSTVSHALNNGTIYSAAASAPGNQRFLRVGGGCGTNYYPPQEGDQFTGRIGEIVVSNADWDDGVIARAWRYFRLKWGI